MKKISLTLLVAIASLGLMTLSVSAQTLTATPVFHFLNKLTLGSTGEDVKQLQILLNKDTATTVAQSPRAGSAGHETSAFGPATALAVKAFQKAHSLPQTGFVGPLTLAALNDALGSGPVVMPSIVKTVVDVTSKPGSATLTVEYNGGGEKPTVWFAYGATPSSMSILSQKITTDKTTGLVQVGIDHIDGECYAVAYVKNSVGTTMGDWIRCFKQ